MRGIGFCRRGAACCALILILVAPTASATQPIELIGFTDSRRDPAAPIFAQFYPTAIRCGAGGGATTSFKLLTPAYGLTRIGIRTRSKTNRSRPLLLVTRNRTYRLLFGEVRRRKPGKTVWFDLLEPDRTSCFSLVVEADDDAKKPSLSLAELALRTEAEGGGGLLEIAADLSDPQRRRQAALLLERGDGASVEAVAAVWPDLDPQGRFLAIGVITRTAPAKGATLLAEALISGSDAEREAARRGLAAAGPAGITALAARAGKGDRAARLLLRRHISSLLARDPNRTAVLGELIAKADAEDDAEALFDLMRIGAARPELREQLLEITVRRYQNNGNFANRYRLLELMGELACADVQDLLKAAAKDPDHQIRAVAVAGLGTCDNPGNNELAPLKTTLRDEAPEVRLAAIRAIRNRSMEKPVLPILADLAVADPWPEVRAQVVQGAGRLSPENAIPILQKTIHDTSPRVREAAIRQAIPFAGLEMDRMIEERLGDKEELPRLTRIAVDAAGARCQETAIPALFAILQKGAEPLAAPDDVLSAVFAARAMGAIGGETAKKLLKKAKTRSNPRTDRAIRDALEALGHPCMGRKSSWILKSHNKIK